MMKFFVTSIFIFTLFNFANLNAQQATTWDVYRIEKVVLLSFPLTKSNGASWDMATGPDLYFELFADGQRVYEPNNGDVFEDAAAQGLPHEYWIGHRVSEIDAESVTTITLKFIDKDGVKSDVVGELSVDMQDKKNKKKKKIKIQSGGLSVELSIYWYKFEGS